MDKYEVERQLSNALKALEGMVVATSSLAENDANVRKAREGAITTLREAGIHLINCQIKQGTIVLPELDVYGEGS